MLNRAANLLLLFLLPLTHLAQPELGETETQQPSTEEQLAAQYYQDGAFQKASDLYEKLYDKNATTFFYQALLNCYIGLKDIKSGERLINKHQKKVGFSPMLGVDLGVFYSKTGEDSKAEKQFEKLIKDNNYSDGFRTYELVEAFRGRKLYSYAGKTIEQSRKNKGEFFNFEMAEIMANQQKWAEMMAEYEALLLRTGYQNLERIESVLQDYLSNDPKGEIALIVRERLLRIVQQKPDQVLFAEMLIWLSVQQRDFDMAFVQVKSLDKRLNENGFRLMDLARLCISNQAFDVAHRAFKTIIEKGSKSEFFTQARLESANLLFLAVNQTAFPSTIQLQDAENALSQVIKDFGINDATLSAVKNYAHLLAFYLNRTAEAQSVLNNVLKTGGLNNRGINQIKLEQADVLLLSGDIWESTLLYSQVEKAFKNDTLGQEAKFRNAKLAYYKGEFDWAKAQLDVLKQATSKLIANDAMELSLLLSDNLAFDTTGEALRFFARADLWIFQKKTSKALQTLDSIAQFFPKNTLADDILFRKALIYESQGKFQEAASEYEKLLSTHRNDILADNSLYRLGLIFETQLKNNEKAMQCYKDLMSEFPGSLFQVDARKRFRILRGDSVN